MNGSGYSLSRCYLIDSQRVRNIGALMKNFERRDFEQLGSGSNVKLTKPVAHSGLLKSHGQGTP